MANVIIIKWGILPTYLPYFTTFLPTYLPTYLPTTYQPTYLHTQLPTHLPPYLFIYLSTHLPPYLFTYLPTHPPTYLLQHTYLRTSQSHNGHNPILRLATKARACKVAIQEGSSGVTSHAPRSAKECEGMNLHTPK